MTSVGWHILKLRAINLYPTSRIFFIVFIYSKFKFSRDYICPHLKTNNKQTEKVNSVLLTSASSLARVSLWLLSISFRHLTISAVLGSVSRTLSRSLCRWRSNSSADFSMSLVLRCRSLSDSGVSAVAVTRPWRRYLFTASLSSLLSSAFLSCSDNFSRSRRTCRAFSTWNNTPPPW